MRTIALPTTALVLAALACDGGPTNPMEYAAPTKDVGVLAVPSNDLFSGATPITIGFSEVLNTAEATTDADDAELANQCTPPATDASVWYAFTSENDVTVVVDVSQSDYSAGLIVAVGSPGSFLVIACGPGSVGFSAAASTTHYILAFDYQADGGGNGGNLNISVTEEVTPTVEEITVNDYGTFDPRTGLATLSGTFTCTNGELFGNVFVTQDAGRFSVSGYGTFFDIGGCDGTPHPWTAQVHPQNGKFAGGKALTVTYVFACGSVWCASDFAEQTVILRGAGGSEGRRES